MTEAFIVFATIFTTIAAVILVVGLSVVINLRAGGGSKRH